MAGKMLRMKGLDALIKKSNKYGKAIQPMMKTATLKAVLFVHSQVPDYPPEPPMSTYRRTLTLFRSITTLQGKAPGALSRMQEMGKIVVGILGTAISYAWYVINRGTQATVHEGRFYTLQDIVEDNEQGIVKIYKDALKDLTHKTFK